MMTRAMPARGDPHRHPCALILPIPIAILSIAVWYHDLPGALQDPVLAIKQVYWLCTKGERRGPLEVLLTDFAVSFVSPRYSCIVLSEGINMRDFGGGPVGTAA